MAKRWAILTERLSHVLLPISPTDCEEAFSCWSYGTEEEDNDDEAEAEAEEAVTNGQEIEDVEDQVQVNPSGQSEESRRENQEEKGKEAMRCDAKNAKQSSTSKT
jgi:hypothetical protein